MKPNRYEGWTLEQLKEEDARLMRDLKARIMEELKESSDEMEAYAKAQGWQLENTWLEDAIETAQREKLTDAAELEQASREKILPVPGILEQLMSKLDKLSSCADLETLEKEHRELAELDAELVERCFFAIEKMLASRLRALGVEVPTK